MKRRYVSKVLKVFTSLDCSSTSFLILKTRTAVEKTKEKSTMLKETTKDKLTVVYVRWERMSYHFPFWSKGTTSGR